MTRKHTHKFTQHIPVEGGMRHKCACGYSFLVASQGVYGKPVSKQTTDSRSVKERNRERNRKKYQNRKKKMNKVPKTPLE